MVEKDEFPRANTTFEGLQALKPAFKTGGTVTAGNAAGERKEKVSLAFMVFF